MNVFEYSNRILLSLLEAYSRVQDPATVHYHHTATLGHTSMELVRGADSFQQD